MSLGKDVGSSIKSGTVAYGIFQILGSIGDVVKYFVRKIAYFIMFILCISYVAISRMFMGKKKVEELKLLPFGKEVRNAFEMYILEKEVTSVHTENIARIFKDNEDGTKRALEAIKNGENVLNSLPEHEESNGEYNLPSVDVREKVMKHYEESQFEGKDSILNQQHGIRKKNQRIRCPHCNSISKVIQELGDGNQYRECRNGHKFLYSYALQAAAQFETNHRVK